MSRDGFYKKARTDRHALKLDYITFDLPEFLWLALSLVAFLVYRLVKEEKRRRTKRVKVIFITKQSRERIAFTQPRFLPQLWFPTKGDKIQEGKPFFSESSIWSFDFCSIKKSTVGLWRNFWRGERIILCIWLNDCQNLHNKTAENIQFCKD